MSHDRICASNASVVRINGNMNRVGGPTNSPLDALFRGTNLVLTSSYGLCSNILSMLIRAELSCTRLNIDVLQRF